MSGKWQHMGALGIALQIPLDQKQSSVILMASAGIIVKNKLCVHVEMVLRFGQLDNSQVFMSVDYSKVSDCL
jgi:hypothetical protein